jgi:hypothetical protein
VKGARDHDVHDCVHAQRCTAGCCSLMPVLPGDILRRPEHIGDWRGEEAQGEVSRLTS